MLHASFPNSPPASDNVFLQTYLAIKTKQNNKQKKREKQKKKVSFWQTLIAKQKTGQRTEKRHCQHELKAGFNHCSLRQDDKAKAASNILSLSSLGRGKNLPAQKLWIMASESHQICQTSSTSTYVTLSNGKLLLKH